MQNTIHPRDLIVGLQKGLALIQLFSKTCPKLTVAQAAKMSGLTQSAARRFLLTLLHGATKTLLLLATSGNARRRAVKNWLDTSPLTRMGSFNSKRFAAEMRKGGKPTSPE